MLSRVYCASTVGVDAQIIDVETHHTNGMVKFFLVGLPDRAVKESRDRVEAAIRNTGSYYPLGRITANLAPADLPKEGNGFDLPIAIGILNMSGQLHTDKLDETVMLGELALDGKIRPVKGVLPVAVEAAKKGFKYLVVPKENGGEAAVVEELEVFPFEHLNQVKDWLENRGSMEPLHCNVHEYFHQNGKHNPLDFSDVRGQENVKRALEIAAAGSHNVVMVGPPGSGKTMMARRIPTILPPLTLDEALETTKIHSVSGILESGKALITRRQFRSPHHTVSDVALVGGGSIPMPGEISMAHNGVLFLDELPEFKRSALEVMRQPLEDGFVSISRARMSVTYPSRVMLVASMNPSPGGDWYDPNDMSGTTNMQMQRYLSKISGPLLDRIDLHIEVHKVSYEELSGKAKGESSADIRKRVVGAREVQSQRFMGMKGVYSNAQMSTRMVRKVCKLDEAGSKILKKAITSLGLSARAYDRILKVSRTIADLDHSETIKSNHVAEAIQYRSLDREGWLG
ncbi:YifB family Mg chelatase-like AAA ATPase [Gracilimonas mengyeensis]|uniref:Magnesium chelatase family protein n=1 Tax=Gracilimonas mengyeensis TaxID=1302730 RepID=A0A521FF80_9BACT|nr:YifB family Mg chelatase-like AAA ATPase [Gracilimonas mengyeensis]SMO94755.1 magnesium chelatase family protein [Gracilimonas mengyeensis]